MRAILLVPALFLLAGCGLFGSRDQVEPPAELVTFTPSAEVQRHWSVSVGGDGGRHLILDPWADGERVVASSANGRVVSIDAASGRALWSRNTGAALSSGPGLGSGVVVVGSRDAQVIALDPDSGDELWRTTVSSEVLAQPQAARGIVVVRTSDGKVHGLDAADGSRRWLHERSVPLLTLRGNSNPVIHGDGVLIGFDGGRLAALALNSGELLWELPVAEPSGRTELERMADINGTPVVADGAVHVTAHRGRTLIASLDGRTLWARDIASRAGLAISRDRLFVSADDDSLWGLDRRNGATIWRQEALTRRQLTAPAVTSQFVLVGDSEGWVHVLSREDGNFVARHRIDSSGIAAAPVAVGETVYIISRSGTLAALRMQ